MKFAKKVGCAVGPNVQLASPIEHANGIQDLAHIDQSLIEIKKEYTYERGQRSKVLVMHAIEQNAKEIDKILHSTMFKHFKHVSCRLSAPKQRLAAMHSNEMINIKSRFETLCQVSLHDKVVYEENVCALKDLLLSVEDQGIKLFLAAEKGSGKHDGDANVILNPKVKGSSRKWLIEKYPIMSFDYQCSKRASVNVEKYVAKERHDNDLKEFLQPILQQKDALKVKGHGKKLKTYAQVVGVDMSSKGNQTAQPKPNQNITKERERNKNQNKDEKDAEIKEKDKEIDDLKKIINEMKAQMEKMTEVIIKVCEDQFGSDMQKDAVMQKLNEIRNLKSTGNEIQQEEENAESNQSDNEMQNLSKNRNEVKIKKKEYESKGKRKKETNGQLTWKESDASGLLSYYVNCGAQHKNRRLEKQMKTNE